MATSSRFLNNILQFWDKVTGEILMPLDPIWFYDDFLGAGHTVIPTTAVAGSYWGAKLVKTAGTPVVSAVANGTNGLVQVSIDATSENQEAVFYCLDQRAYSLQQSLKYETRIQLATVPTAGCKAVWGVASAYVAGPNNLAQYARFAVNGSGAVLCETYDGTTAVSVASGFSFTGNGDAHIFRVDSSGLAFGTGIVFYIDGNQVLENTSFPFVATGANAQVQPYIDVYKASGTSVGSLYVDFVSLSGARS